MQQLAEKDGRTRQQVRVEIDRVGGRSRPTTRRRCGPSVSSRLRSPSNGSSRAGSATAWRSTACFAAKVDTNRELFCLPAGPAPRDARSRAALFTSKISVVDARRCRARRTSQHSRKGILIAGARPGSCSGRAGLPVRILDMNIKDTKEVESSCASPPSAWCRRAMRSRDGARAGTRAADGAPFALLAHSGDASVFSRPSATCARACSLDARPSAEDDPVTSPHPEDGKTSLVDEPGHHARPAGIGRDYRHHGTCATNLHNSSRSEGAPACRPTSRGRPSSRNVIVATAIRISRSPAGRLPVNPSELVAPPGSRQALETLGQRFRLHRHRHGPLFGVSDGNDPGWTGGRRGPGSSDRGARVVTAAQRAIREPHVGAWPAARP